MQYDAPVNPMSLLYKLALGYFYSYFTYRIPSSGLYRVILLSIKAPGGAYLPAREKAHDKRLSTLQVLIYRGRPRREGSRLCFSIGLLKSANVIQ